MTDVTRILNAIEHGNPQAADELLPLIYEELRILATQKLSHEVPGQTLQATALVHEAYIRLVGKDDRNWDNRGHFFTAAAEAMRRILIDIARRKKSQRRGGQRQRVNLDSLKVVSEETSDCLIELDFGGLTLEQAAEIKGISRRTAGRYWKYARLWLYREMAKGDEQTI